MFQQIFRRTSVIKLPMNMPLVIPTNILMGGPSVSPTVFVFRWKDFSLSSSTDITNRKVIGSIRRQFHYHKFEPCHIFNSLPSFPLHISYLLWFCSIGSWRNKCNSWFLLVLHGKLFFYYSISTVHRWLLIKLYLVDWIMLFFII